MGLLAYGIEPSAEGFAYGKKEGLNVVQGDIENISYSFDSRFNIVTLMNVLEHLREPANVLISIRETYLHKDGVLVIDVPNEFNDFQVAADQEYGLKSWWICPPAHINYFSPESLISLLQHCGYQVLHKESSFPMEIFLLLGDVYVGNNEIGSQCHEKRVKFEQTLVKQGKINALRKFYSALADVGLGRQITVYARPKK